MSILAFCHACGNRMVRPRTVCSTCGSEFVEFIDRNARPVVQDASPAPPPASRLPRRPRRNDGTEASPNEPSATPQLPFPSQDVVTNVIRALGASVATNTLFSFEGADVEHSLNMPITWEVQMTGAGGRHFRIGTDDNVMNSMDRIMQDLFHVVDQPLNGLTEQQLRNIPIIKVTETQEKDETQCSTCLDLFKLGESVAQLNCMHIFHQQCVEPWLKQQRSCPICRQVVNPRVWSTSSPRSGGERNLSDLEDLD